MAHPQITNTAGATDRRVTRAGWLSAIVVAVAAALALLMREAGIAVAAAIFSAAVVVVACVSGRWITWMIAAAGGVALTGMELSRGPWVFRPETLTILGGFAIVSVAAINLSRSRLVPGPANAGTDAGVQPMADRSSPNVAQPAGGGSTSESAAQARKLAHDLRNSLGVIRNAAHLLRRRASQANVNTDLADMIDAEILLADSIVAQMLESTRGGSSSIHSDRDGSAAETAGPDSARPPFRTRSAVAESRGA